MKKILSLIKNCLPGFIIVLISIFSFNVSAKSANNVDYSNGYSSDIDLGIYENYIDDLIKYLDNNYNQYTLLFRTTFDLVDGVKNYRLYSMFIMTGTDIEQKNFNIDYVNLSYYGTQYHGAYNLNKLTESSNQGLIHQSQLELLFSNYILKNLKLPTGNHFTTDSGINLDLYNYAHPYYHGYFPYKTKNMDWYIGSRIYDENIKIEDNVYTTGDKLPSYVEYNVQKPVITYDYTFTAKPYDNNYAYFKFKGVGDLELFFKYNSNNLNNLFFDIYKNDKLIYVPIVGKDVDTHMTEFFKNSLESDVFTVVAPFYKKASNGLLNDTDTFSLSFTAPGLFEYGTDSKIYKVVTDENGNKTVEESEANRDEINDILKPPDSSYTEVVSVPSSTTALTNASLNEFSWPYSLFARNGNNITNISLSASYSATSNLNINDFDNRLLINYGQELYKININNCILKKDCVLTKYEQDLIKRILFDRDVENADNYLDFVIRPLSNLTFDKATQFNVGLSLEFSSSVELTINSFLLAIKDISHSYYNVYFKLYDSKGNIHTIYKTALNSDYIGVNQFKLENRTADIYKVDLMLVFNQESTSFNTISKYNMALSEFNIFANTNLIHIYTDKSNVTYQTCEWYNGFCHIQNGFTWLIYEAPIFSDFWELFLKFFNIFEIVRVLIGYVFMPLDMIPPLFGIPISTILPIILVLLFIIKKLWLGGSSD